MVFPVVMYGCELRLPGWHSGKHLPVKAGYARDSFDLWVGKIPWSRKWQPTPVFLPGKSHEQRSLADYSPRGCKELDTSERLNTQYVSYILDKKIIHRNEKHYWQGHVDLWQLDKDTRKRVTGLLSALSSLGSGYNRFGGFPGGPDGKKSACNVGDWGLIRSWQPTPVFLHSQFYANHTIISKFAACK